VWAVGCRMAGGPGLPSTGALVRWDGQKWLDVPLPQISDSGGGMCTGSVAARSATDVFVTGEVYNPGSGGGGRDLNMHWDGRQWTDLGTISTGREIHQIQVVTAAGDVWIAGSIDIVNEAAAVRSIMKRWIGDNIWQPVGALEARAGMVTSIVPDGHGGILAVTSKGPGEPNLVRVGRDNTVTWAGGPSGVTYLNGLATVPGTSTVWAVGAGPDGPVAAYSTW
jgi:hypothetical protein